MIKAEEISEIIKRQLQGYEAEVDLKEAGRVIEVGDGIARIYGLQGAMAGGGPPPRPRARPPPPPRPRGARAPGAPPVPGRPFPSSTPPGKRTRPAPAARGRGSTSPA